MKADSSSSRQVGAPQNDRTLLLCHSERLVLSQVEGPVLSIVEGSEESTLSFVASKLVSDGFSPWASQGSP